MGGLLCFVSSKMLFHWPWSSSGRFFFFFLTVCFFIALILQPLNTMLRNSTNSTECGQRKLQPALTRPLRVFEAVRQCAHLSMYCIACVPACVFHESQLQSTVRVSFYLILALFSSLSTPSLSSPQDMGRLSQVAFTDCYHWLQPPSTHTHFPFPVCVSRFLASPLPSSPPRLFLLLLSLSFLSIWLSSHVA